MRDRKKQRELRKQGKKEETLDRYDAYGNKDMTPFNAVNVMNKKEIKLK